jgi:hypothetical protein
MRVDHRAPERLRGLLDTRKVLKTDPMVDRIKKAKPGQIDTWIDNHVTDLDSSKAVLKAMAKMLRYILLKIDVEPRGASPAPGSAVRGHDHRWRQRCKAS